jgi:hypothetical protein
MLPQPAERLIAGLVQKFCVSMDLATDKRPEAGGDVSPKAAASDDKAPGNADGPCDLRAGQVRCAYKNNLFCHDIVPVYWQNVYKKRSGSLTPGKGGNWGKAREDASALLFAGKGRQTVGAGLYLAPLGAGFACSKLGAYNQRTAPSARITAGILPAPVADPVFHGADIRSVRAAREIGPVTGGKPAGGRDGRSGRDGSQNGRRYRCGRHFSAGSQGAAGSKERRDKQKTANARNDTRVFHGR